MKVKIRNEEKELVFVDGKNGRAAYHEVDGIPFDGHRVMWRLEYVPETYLKESELSGDEWRQGGQAKIYRNDVCVLNEFCRRAERAIFIFAEKLPYLQDFGGWDDIVVGRKMYYMETPAVIERVLEDGEIIVAIEDQTKEFPLWGYQQEDLKEDGYIDRDWSKKSRVHILDPRIWWWRK